MFVFSPTWGVSISNWCWLWSNAPEQAIICLKWNFHNILRALLWLCNYVDFTEPSLNQSPSSKARRLMLVFDNLKMMVIWQQMHAGDMMRFLETEIVLARSIRCVFYNFSIKLEILNCYFWSKTTNLVFSPSSLIIGLYRFFIHQDFSFVFVVVWKSKHLIFGIWLIRSYVKKLFFVLLWLSSFMPGSWYSLNG